MTHSVSLSVGTLGSRFPPLKSTPSLLTEVDRDDRTGISLASCIIGGGTQALPRHNEL